MIPILYEKTETTFTSNGIGRLSDCLSCLVTEERNGIYEVEFTYPVSGVRFEDITVGRIISCTHDEQGDAQPFDIYAKSEPINGVVTFRGRHISYRLNEITVKPFTAGSCAAAIAGLKTNSIGNNLFTFWTDKSVTSDYTVAVPSKLRGLLGGEQNSLLDVYGTGEYEFSKFDVKLYLHRGQDTNVGIRYGKNLVDFTNEYSAGDIYTAVVPFWSGSETVQSGDESITVPVVVTLPEWYLSSGQSSPGGREIIVPMDLSADFSEKPTVNQLRTLATSKLSSSDAWVPAQTITVDFVQLWQTDEYKDYAPLQRLKLCDTCGVFVPMYGISLRVKVIKVVYNTLLDRYDSMELGDKPTTYAAVLEKNYDSKVAGLVEGLQALSVDIGTVEANAAADATAKANAAEQNANNYTDGEISDLRNDLETQIDAKIETWAQSSNPATAWTTAELRTEHNGDLWLYTGTSNTTVGGVTIHPQGVYQYNGANNTWVAYSSTSANLFDLADGKTTIFYGPTSGTYNNVQTGDYLVDNTTGSTYRWSGSAWVKQTDYATAISNATTSITNAYNQAIADATDLICGGTGGYIITTLNGNGQPVELLITDNIDINQAVNVWRWNSGGLGHSHNGYAGPFNDIAITQDGKINASMILTGILTANIITAGTISDSSGKNSWDLDSGQFSTKQGVIGPFDISDNGLEYYLDNGKYNSGALVKLSDEGFITTLHEYSGGNAYTWGVLIGKNASWGLDLKLLAKWNTQNAKDYSDIGRITLAGSTNHVDYYAWIYFNNQQLVSLQPSSGSTYIVVWSDFSVQGTKSREVKTDNYSNRLLYCYETPTPMFGDIGEATLDEDGICYVDLDDIFTETIAERVEYQVFLQKEGEGDCWVSGKAPRYFVIQGTPGLRVAWELKAKQRDYANIRLEQSGRDLDEYINTFDDNNSLDDFINEQEELLYG